MGTLVRDVTATAHGSLARRCAISKRHSNRHRRRVFNFSTKLTRFCVVSDSI